MPRHSRLLRQLKLSRFRPGTVLLMAALIMACSTEEPVPTAGANLSATDSPQLTLRTLSTQPWLVSGGDVLIEVALAATVSPVRPRLLLDGADISTELQRVTPQVYQALVTDLPIGDSLLRAELAGSPVTAELRLSNYPISGPMISGPHQQPYFCQTEDFVTAAGSSLGPPLNSECHAQTRTEYVYWSQTGNEFMPLPRGSQPLPEDIAEIADYQGNPVPFIVRVETGVVNRAIYEIAMLHQPLDGAIDPWNRSPAWNGKLVYTHGGGCRSGWYQQGDRTGGVLRRGLLEMGYATVSSTLNVFGQNCNDLLASETHIMVKERFIERYGVPEYTIATGASGGSYQSHQTADNYPGVFDGIIVAASFPDVTSATVFTLADARLLHHYFNNVNPDGFSVEQQRAVAGFGEHASIANLARGAARLDPSFDPDAPAEAQGGEVSVPELETLRYSAIDRNGVRATVYDHTVNVYGRIDGTNTAQRPLDNVGVQYGLVALNAGTITPQQFIELNRDIGGFDHDLNPVPERHGADSQARRRAIESGRILFGGAGLAATPIIDYRTYTDDRDGGDIHMIVHQFSTRQRLINANGHADNHIMQVGGRWGFSEEEPDLGELFRQMDSWITGIKADSGPGDPFEKVIRNKPAALTDACWAEQGGDRVRIEEVQTYIGDNQCNALYPAFSTPRHVAGAPLANDIVSCHLRPLSRIDYAVDFTPEQWAALQTVFPSGVCDWSRGDVSGAVHQGTWASFGPSPVNRLY